MKAASQVPSGVLISTSVSTTDAAAEPAPAAARPAATDIATKSRLGRSRDSSLFLGSFVSSGIANLLSHKVYRFLLLPSGEAFEEALLVPMRTIGGVRHALAYIEQDAVELSGRGFVHRLVEIVGGRMIAVLQPILGQRLFGRPWEVAELERQRRHSLLNEAVLIAADEQIAIRLLIRLHLDS